MLHVHEEVELTVTMEVGGRMAGFESRLEARKEDGSGALGGAFGSLAGEDKPD